MFPRFNDPMAQSVRLAAGRAVLVNSSVLADDPSLCGLLALAAVYRNTNRVPQAIDLYKQLIDKPTQTVGKTMAPMELAATYESANQPQEAKRIYEQVQKDNPSGQIAQMAMAKLRELK